MSDQDWAERFCADLDRLFRTGTLADSTERTPEYSELLALAQTLSSTNFSDQSQIQPVLRRRLLTSMGARKGWRLQEKISMPTLFQKRRFVSVLPTVILAGLLIATLVWTGGLTAIAQGAIDFVERLWIGEYTSIEPFDIKQLFGEPRSTGGEECVPTLKECKIVRLDDRLLGEDGVPRRFDTPAAAQAALSFTLRQPGYMPEGYTFNEAKVWGDGDLATVDLLYDGPSGNCDGRIMLSQSPVGEQSGQAVSIGLPQVTAVETVQVNGRSATWAEGTLLWESDGVSYLLTCRSDLSLAEAVRIAESLE